MVLACPKIMELEAGSPGFFGVSFRLTKRKLPRKEHMSCGLGYFHLHLVKRQLVPIYLPGG